MGELIRYSARPSVSSCVREFDVVVVGAGPAGSTAAGQCADRGLSTALLDRAQFPRDKPCGGGVTARAASLLPFDINEVVERRLREVRFSWQGKLQFTRQADKTLVYMTQRTNFDEFLVQKAIEAGTHFFESRRVDAVHSINGSTVVSAGKEQFVASVVIGADGVNSSVARLAGFELNTVLGVALEGNFPQPSGDFSEWDKTLAFDFGTVSGGYGWIFPKRNHLNVGVGGWISNGPNLRRMMSELARHYGLEPSDGWGVRGYRLPVRAVTSPLRRGQVLLVGDAAGLVDPLTGEGIYGSIYSGRAAARAVSNFLIGDAPDLSGYESELESQLLDELAAGQYIHGLFHLAPHFFFQLSKHGERPWRLARDFLLGDRTHKHVRQKLGRLWPVVKLTGGLVVLRSGFRRR